MKRLLLAVMLATQLAAAAMAGEARALVLVCRADSPLLELTAADARKAYLGAPVIVAGQRIEAIRNKSDPILDEVFLQKVVFLSAPAYERQVLSRVFRLGGNKPAVYDALPELLSAVRSSPAAVTYMWDKSAAQNPDLRVVGILWTGEVE